MNQTIQLENACYKSGEETLSELASLKKEPVVIDPWRTKIQMAFHHDFGWMESYFTKPIFTTNSTPMANLSPQCYDGWTFDDTRPEVVLESDMKLEKKRKDGSISVSHKQNKQK